MAGFGDGIGSRWDLSGDDGFEHNRDHLAWLAGFAVYADNFLHGNLGGNVNISNRRSNTEF